MKSRQLLAKHFYAKRSIYDFRLVTKLYLCLMKAHHSSDAHSYGLSKAVLFMFITYEKCNVFAPNVSILRACKNTLTSHCDGKSRFQGKMIYQRYQFRDSLQFMHRKYENNAFENSYTFHCWLCEFLFRRLFCLMLTARVISDHSVLKTKCYVVKKILSFL